jgi:hypothetical protein
MGLDVRLEAAEEGIAEVAHLRGGEVGGDGLELGSVGRDGGGLLDRVEVPTSLVLGVGDAEGDGEGVTEGGEGGEAARSGERGGGGGGKA